MKKLLLTLLLLTLAQANLQASADLGDTHLPPFGHKTDCKQWKTQIDKTEKKAKKSTNDFKNLETLKYHFNTQKCDEKLRAKAKK